MVTTQHKQIRPHRKSNSEKTPQRLGGQSNYMKGLIVSPMCSCGLFITSTLAFDEQRHVGQLCVCARLCMCVCAPVCISGSVVSSDKRRTGSTSLREEGKPRPWGDWWKGGWGESSERRVTCWKIHEWEGGQLWRSQSRFGFERVSWPHLRRMQICDNTTGGCELALPLNHST